MNPFLLGVLHIVRETYQMQLHIPQHCVLPGDFIGALRDGVAKGYLEATTYDGNAGVIDRYDLTAAGLSAIEPEVGDAADE